MVGPSWIVLGVAVVSKGRDTGYCELKSWLKMVPQGTVTVKGEVTVALVLMSTALTV